MISKAADYLVLTIAAAPFIYYLLVLYSSRLFFRQAKNGSSTNLDFAPPVSNLRPIRGLDPEAYENFASYCRQDYPDYELIFCVGDENDASVPVLQKLKRQATLSSAAGAGRRRCGRSSPGKGEPSYRSKRQGSVQPKRNRTTWSVLPLR